MSPLFVSRIVLQIKRYPDREPCSTLSAMRNLPLISASIIAAIVLLPAASAGARQGQPATRPSSDQAVQSEVTGNVLRPAPVEATDERIASLNVPEGFTISVFARDLEKPRWFAVAGDGSVYVTSREAGTVVRLRDTDGDGSADENQTVLRDKPGIHGIWIDQEERQVFLVDIHDVYRAPLEEGGGFGELETIVSGLPDAGQHPNRTLAIGPDRKLYISVGSLSNSATERDERAATMVRCELDGSGMEIFAKGLRNTIGFGWHPRTREMWGMDHGIDWLGDDKPEEELNRLEEGKHYGHPWVWNDGNVNEDKAQDPPEGYQSVEAFAREVAQPALTYTAHASPLQMAFYTGDAFPAEFRGDAFVAMRGSWNRRPPSGYEVVRIDFDDQGQPRSIEPFIGRWVSEDGAEHFGRLCGMAMLPDGSLLVGDDTNGVIYRVTHGAGR